MEAVIDSMRQVRRARRVSLAAAAAAVVAATAACSIPTLWGDDLSAGDLEGTYILEQVDGRPVEEGESSLGLTPQSGGTAPLYGWDVRPPQVEDFDRDIGIWRIRGDAVQFRSQDGLGTYTATPEPVTDGRPGGPRLTVRGHAGRRYTFRRVRSASLSTGEALLEIAVVDPAGGYVPGAYLRIRAPDGVVSPASTTEFGPLLTSGPAGEWTVTVTLPAGYAVAPGQANPARVAAAARETATLRIALVPIGGG